MNEGAELGRVDGMGHVEEEDDEEDDERRRWVDCVFGPWLEDKLSESRDSRIDDLAFWFLALFEFLCIKSGFWDPWTRGS